MIVAGTSGPARAATFPSKGCEREAAGAARSVPVVRRPDGRRAGAEVEPAAVRQQVEPHAEQGDRVVLARRVHHGRVLSVDHGGHAGAEDFEAAVLDQHAGVLVQAYAQVLGCHGHAGQQPWQPAALTEVHVDERLRHKAETWSSANRRGGHLGPGPAEDHGAAHRGGTGARAGDHQTVGQPVGDDVVDPRADQGPQLGLVAAADEDSGCGRQQVGEVVTVGVTAAVQPKLAQVVDAELAEHSLVLGEYLVRRVRRGRDQHDPGGLAPAQLDEPLEQAGTATAVLSSADDEQPTRRFLVLGHVLALAPDRSVHDAVLPGATQSQPQGQIQEGNGDAGGWQPPGSVIWAYGEGLVTAG